MSRAGLQVSISLRNNEDIIRPDTCLSQDRSGDVVLSVRASGKTTWPYLAVKHPSVVNTRLANLQQSLSQVDCNHTETKESTRKLPFTCQTITSLMRASHHSNAF